MRRGDVLHLKAEKALPAQPQTAIDRCSLVTSMLPKPLS
jgi:hypothetical protein